MKYLIILLLLLLLPTPVRGAVSWESYSQGEVCDYFESGPVDMKATGLGADKLYRVRYYDSGDVLLQTDDGYSSGGELIGTINPLHYPASQAGMWTAELYKMQPKESLLATDTFEVTQSAIPEFSKYGILAFLILGLIYLRRRR